VDTIVDLILVKTESTKERVLLDVYLRNQNFDDPTRFAKSGSGVLIFRDTNQLARKIQDYSSNFSSIFLSPEHWSQQDRMENPSSNGSIFLPKQDLGIQDRSVMIPIITNNYSKEVSYYREYVYRLHIIVG